MNVKALVPMKKHSERVPNKNMKNFCGKPLYHKVIESLAESKYIREICINTDSKQIAEDAQSHFNNVRIIDRPEKLIGDHVAMNDIIGYDITKLEGEHFLQTHSTNPLLTSDTIDSAIETYFEKLDKFDSLFSVNRLQTRLYWESGEPVNHNPDELLRTQDLPPLFEENSNIYIFSKSSFTKASNRRIGMKPFMLEMDNLESIDIDEPEDFMLAETLYSQLRCKHE